MQEEWSRMIRFLFFLFVLFFAVVIVFLLHCTLHWYSERRIVISKTGFVVIALFDEMFSSVSLFVYLSPVDHLETKSDHTSNVRLFILVRVKLKAEPCYINRGLPPSPTPSQEAEEDHQQQQQTETTKNNQTPPPPHPKNNKTHTTKNLNGKLRVVTSFCSFFPASASLIKINK